MRKLFEIGEIWLQKWKGPLYKLSKYVISFGLGLQIRVHRPLSLAKWPLIFSNGPSFLSILYTFNKERGHWPILMAPAFTNPDYSLNFWMVSDRAFIFRDFAIFQCREKNMRVWRQGASILRPLLPRTDFIGSHCPRTVVKTESVTKKWRSSWVDLWFFQRGS